MKKVRKKDKKESFTKLNNAGISLIVLIITIIVIIILSTAIIVSVVSNNPIDEANTARYESDRDNMQAVFTNTVAKIMAKNKGTVSVTAGQINTVTNGVSSATGSVSYTVTNPMNSQNASGTIIFDAGENTDTVFYTGKQLPIYKAAETKWYVSEEGEILLEVGENKYGEGEITFAPGAYDANNVMLASWDELVNDYGLDVQSNYSIVSYKTSPSSMYSVINNNELLNSTTKIIMGDDVTKIGVCAFYGCTELTSITIGNSVISIGSLAFSTNAREPNSLESIIIPESVTSIDSRSFAECNQLVSIKVDENNTIYDSRNNCNSVIETATNKLVLGCKTSTVDNTVTSIGDWAFYKCATLESITIPESVTSIGVNAFAYCRGLTTIKIPDSVTSIGNVAFGGCSELKSIIIGNSVESIGENAFQACKVLTTVKIPESVTSIGVRAFMECTGLTSIIVEEGNTVYDSRDNCNAIIETATNKLITGCKTSVIPNTITSIGKQAFINCTGLTSVIIPESVTNIENNAFIGCSGLTSIKVEDGNTVYDSRDNCNAIIETTTNKLTKGCKNSVIPNTVVTIGSTAFRESIGLTAVIIPESVVKIEEQAFYDCDSLTSIIISKSVTSIGVNVFSDCNSLISIKVDEENTVYDSRDNCNAIIEKSSNKLISGCKTSAIPNTVTNISNYAFYYCTELESITIPESVTAIGSFAFVSCDNLKTIYYKGTATGAPWGATSATVVSEY